MIFIKDVFNIFFPRICYCCNDTLLDAEKIVCIRCHHKLPFTSFSNETENLLERSFYGRVPLIQATALFFYAKNGMVQQLIHQLKYRGHENIGGWAGSYLGGLMLSSNRFKEIDLVVPVPLHKSKKRKRGYNQLTRFGRKLASILEVPFNTGDLIRISQIQTQTKKGRIDRWANVSGQFKVRYENTLKNKHVLLVDDVVTTGATIESCYEALKIVPGIRISLACIAFTD